MNLPTNNADYKGRASAWKVLVFVGVLNLVRGSIHMFAEDGGAGRIAGIDLAQNGEVIVSLFAAWGAGQFTTGLLDLFVGLRYRVFVPFILAIEAIRTSLALSFVWYVKPFPVDAPGKFLWPVFLIVILFALWASRPSSEAEPTVKS